MKDYGRVQSNVQPKPLEIDECSVWIATDIQEVDLPVGGTGEDQETVKGYEYHMIQYDKDEYILSIHDDLASTQEAVDFLLMNS